jgi:hypothetical protein
MVTKICMGSELPGTLNIVLKYHGSMSIAPLLTLGNVALGRSNGDAGLVFDGDPNGFGLTQKGVTQ